MPNLYVFDKDSTIVHPRKDGYIGHPEDQVLYEGVRDKLDRLRSEGHVLAIASNQGGCDYHEVGAGRLSVGSSFMRGHPECHIFNKIYKTMRIWSTESGSSVAASATETVWMNEEWVRKTIESRFFFTHYDLVLMQHKTIECAIAEMQFAADLCGIEDAIFCPAMDGHNAIAMMKSHSEWFSDEVDSTVLERCGNFRKPGMGMLKFAEIYLSSGVQYDRGIMIGDRDSDRQSAIAAGFEFMWADEWRNE